MATTTTSNPRNTYEFFLSKDNKAVTNELYEKLAEAIKSLNRGDGINAFKAVVSISRSLG